MATAYAKLTGEVGVCLATQEPDAIHLLNGLYAANQDHRPMVLIGGEVARESAGGDFQQGVDLSTLSKEVDSAFVGVIQTPSRSVTWWTVPSGLPYRRGSSHA